MIVKLVNKPYPILLGNFMLFAGFIFPGIGYSVAKY